MQRKETLEDAKKPRKKLGQSDHDEFFLRKDSAVSEENIKGLQAPVARKGKEALGYRSQAAGATKQQLLLATYENLQQPIKT